MRTLLTTSVSVLIKTSMRKYQFPIFLFSFILLGFSACNSGTQSKEKDQAISNYQENQKQMQNLQASFKALPAVAENPENPITPAKIELGKALYYDTRLSKTGNNSCNSCHNLATFGVDNLATSKGDAGKFGERNSPTVLNAAFHSFQFWDGRAKDVEEQAGMPILNPVEMAIPSKDFLVKKLSGIKEYQDMFAAAFPNEKASLTYENLQKAIAAFERTLVTPAPFDKYLNGDMSALTQEQVDGLKTFMEVGCTTCHNGASLGGNTFQKFGVSADYRTILKPKVNDEGKKKATKAESDKDMFKVPGLRNITKTAPYFHDGSVKDLSEAVKIMASLQLNKNLTEAQTTSIVKFLESLTGEVPASAKEIPAMLAKK